MKYNTKKLKVAKAVKGQTYAAIARATGLAVNTVRRVFTGHSRPESVAKVAATVGLKVGDLYDWS